MSSSKSPLRPLGSLLASVALAALCVSASLEAQQTRAALGSARSAADEVVLLSRVEVMCLLTLGYDTAAADIMWM